MKKGEKDEEEEEKGKGRKEGISKKERGKFCCNGAHLLIRSCPVRK